jgi:hypothetical protein
MKMGSFLLCRDGLLDKFLCDWFVRRFAIILLSLTLIYLHAFALILNFNISWGILALNHFNAIYTLSIRFLFGKVLNNSESSFGLFLFVEEMDVCILFLSLNHFDVSSYVVMLTFLGEFLNNCKRIVLIVSWWVHFYVIGMVLNQIHIA